MKARWVNRLFLLVVAFCLTVQGGGKLPVVSGQVLSQERSAGSIDILQSNTQELIVDVVAPQFTFKTVGDCQVLDAPGWVASTQPGQPQLPAKGWLVGLPPQGEPETGVEITGPVRVLDGIDLCPAARLTQLDTAPDTQPSYAETRVKDVLAYQANQDYPGKLAVITQEGYIRSQRVGSLKIQPFQYNPVSRRMTIYSGLRVRVKFDAGLRPVSTQIPGEGAFEGILQGSLLNYAAARSWRSPVQASFLPASMVFQPGSMQPAYRISVVQDGIYQVTYGDMLAAGIPADTLNTLDPRTLRLYNGDGEVSLSMDGSNPLVFGPGDGFLFYGQRNRTRYTDKNIYWLTWGGAAGLRMAPVEGAPGAGIISGDSQRTAHAEQNPYYIMRYPNGPDNDHWYWDFIQAVSVNKAKSYTINLTNVSSDTSTPAKIRGLLRDYSSNSPQHTRIFLNNKLVREDTWPAGSDYAFEVSVAQSLLVNGANTVKIEVVLDPGVTLKVALVNWFEISYTRDNVVQTNKISFSGDAPGAWKFSANGFTTNDLVVMDITDPVHPDWITNFSTSDAGGGLFNLSFEQNIAAAHEYTAAARNALLSPDGIQAAQPADLLDGANGADLIIISHIDFLSALQPLVNFHAAQGLRTKLVNVQDIYDEFSGGIFDPQAIHDFLAYAYTNWAGPAPTYVLLVGDGNYDFKNYLGLNEPNYIPPYLADVDPWLGEVPIDNRYVTVSGGDILPDMAIGRLPVKTAAEAADVVNKILAYAQAPLEDWTNNVLLAADEVDLGAGNFVDSSDQLLDFLPSTKIVDKIYYKITQPTLPLTTAAIVNAINDGRLIVNYVGHASTYNWSGDKIFGTANVTDLNNSDRDPFFLSMACSLGYFIYPPISGLDHSSVDEMLVRKSSGGAIAAFSPTGFGLVSDHDLLAQGVLQAIFRDHVLEFGRATTQAKFFMYANTTGYQGLVDTFMLIGDPALQIRADEFKTYLPDVHK